MRLQYNSSKNQNESNGSVYCNTSMGTRVCVCAGVGWWQLRWWMKVRCMVASTYRGHYMRRVMSQGCTFFFNGQADVNNNNNKNVIYVGRPFATCQHCIACTITCEYTDTPGYIFKINQSIFIVHSIFMIIKTVGKIRS